MFTNVQRFYRGADVNIAKLSIPTAVLKID